MSKGWHRRFTEVLDGKTVQLPDIDQRGYYGDPVKSCTCSSGAVTKYQKRISGPLLDRIDIHVEVPRVEYEKLSDRRLGESPASIQVRVEAAREIQRTRFDQGAAACATHFQSASHPTLA